MKKENVHAKHKKSLAERFWKQKYLFLLLLPSLVWVILICYAPMTGLYMSFINYTPQGSGYFADMANSQFVGLDWFKYFFSTDFTKIMRNTLATSLLTLLFSFPLPIILALCLNEVRNQKAKKFVQTASYIPYFISWVIVGGLIFDIFGIGGLFNNIRNVLGLDSVLVMQKESCFRPIYIISSIWKESGWGTVVYLAAMSGIDPTLYESAAMDGASRLQRMRYITFPLLIPTIVTLFLLNIGSFLDLGFKLQTPMAYSVSDIFDTYVYRVGIQQAQYSFTTAVGLFQSVVGLILVLIFNKLSQKTTEGGLL